MGGLFWSIFGADSGRSMVTLNEVGLAPMQAIAADPPPAGRAGADERLANVLRCDRSTVTWITDRLEERRPRRAQADARDRRVKLLALTEEGVALREVVQLRMSEPPPPLKRLSDEDAAALRDILQRALVS